MKTTSRGNSTWRAEKGFPFVGPAGRLLRKALTEVGIEPEAAYLTDAVKHFNWRQGAGWKRLHQKPARRKIAACLPWLELELVRPDLVIGLGATACQSMLGPDV